MEKLNTIIKNNAISEEKLMFKNLPFLELYCPRISIYIQGGPAISKTYPDQNSDPLNIPDDNAIRPKQISITFQNITSL